MITKRKIIDLLCHNGLLDGDFEGAIGAAIDILRMCANNADNSIDSASLIHAANVLEKQVIPKIS